MRVSFLTRIFEKQQKSMVQGFVSAEAGSKSIFPELLSSRFVKGTIERKVFPEVFHHTAIPQGGILNTLSAENTIRNFAQKAEKKENFFTKIIEKLHPTKAEQKETKIKRFLQDTGETRTQNLSEKVKKTDKQDLVTQIKNKFLHKTEQSGNKSAKKFVAENTGREKSKNSTFKLLNKFKKQKTNPSAKNTEKIGKTKFVRIKTSKTPVQNLKSEFLTKESEIEKSCVAECKNKIEKATDHIRTRAKNARQYLASFKKNLGTKPCATQATNIPQKGKFKLKGKLKTAGTTPKRAKEITPNKQKIEQPITEKQNKSLPTTGNRNPFATQTPVEINRSIQNRNFTEGRKAIVTPAEQEKLTTCNTNIATTETNSRIQKTNGNTPHKVNLEEATKDTQNTKGILDSATTPLEQKQSHNHKKIIRNQKHKEVHAHNSEQKKQGQKITNPFEQASAEKFIKQDKTFSELEALYPSDAFDRCVKKNGLQNTLLMIFNDSNSVSETSLNRALNLFKHNRNIQEEVLLNANIKEFAELLNLADKRTIKKLGGTDFVNSYQTNLLNKKYEQLFGHQYKMCG